MMPEPNVELMNKDLNHDFSILHPIFLPVLANMHHSESHPTVWEKEENVLISWKHKVRIYFE